MRRSPLPLFLLFVITLLISIAERGYANEKRPPNFIFILIDDID